MICYTDGSCSYNPGPGGFGVVVLDDNEKPITYHSERYENTTNNRMELQAIYEVMKKYGSDSIFGANLVYTDSVYAMKCLTEWADTWDKNNWRTSKGTPVENQDLIKPMYELYWKDHFIVIKKCDGHSGIEGNELADKLATGELTADQILKNNS